MKLLVYMRDGRTVFVINGRGMLGRLMQRDPSHTEKSIPALRGTWNPTTGEYAWFGVKLRHLAKASISHVEEAGYGNHNVPDDLPEREAPAK